MTFPPDILTNSFSRWIFITAQFKTDPSAILNAFYLSFFFLLILHLILKFRHYVLCGGEKLVYDSHFNQAINLILIIRFLGTLWASWNSGVGCSTRTGIAKGEMMCQPLWLLTLSLIKSFRWLPLSHHTGPRWFPLGNSFIDWHQLFFVAPRFLQPAHLVNWKWQKETHILDLLFSILLDGSGGGIMQYLAMKKPMSISTTSFLMKWIFSDWPPPLGLNISETAVPCFGLASRCTPLYPIGIQFSNLTL